MNEPLAMPDFDEFVTAIRERCDPKLILDVGAGDFYDTERLGAAFPQAEVIGIEPFCEEASYGNTRRVAAVVVAKAGEVVFHDYHLKGLSSIYARTNYNPARERTVVGRTLDDICGDMRPDVAKIDVEGASLDVLMGGAVALSEAKVVHIETELAECFIDAAKHNAVCARMAEMGFVKHSSRDNEMQADTIWMRP